MKTQNHGYRSTFSLTSPLYGCGCSKPRPVRLTLRKKTRHPLYRIPVGPQEWSGRLTNSRPPTGFDPRTFQLVAILILYIASAVPDWFLFSIFLVLPPVRISSLVYSSPIHSVCPYPSPSAAISQVHTPQPSFAIPCSLHVTIHKSPYISTLQTLRYQNRFRKCRQWTTKLNKHGYITRQVQVQVQVWR